MTDDDARQRRADALVRAAFDEPALTAEELLAVPRLVADDAATDLALWVSIALREGRIPKRARPVAERANADPSANNAVALAVALDKVAADKALGPDARLRAEELADRVRVSGGLLGDTACCLHASHRAGRLARAHWDSPDHARALYVAQVEFALRAERGPSTRHARGKVRTVAAEEARGAAAIVLARAGPAGPVRDDTGMDPRDPDHPDYVHEEDLDEAPEAGVVVFPQACADAAGKGDNAKAARRALGRALGARLPLVPVPRDWTAWEQALVAEAPWLAPAVRAVRTGQGGRTHWGGGVVCIEGPPGSGKSRLVRRLAESSGLPFARYQCDATSDNSLAGTPVRWSTGHLSVMERMLAQALKACGIVLLDEIEKAGGTRQSGGHPHDVMHGLFEPETARAWRSQYLLADVDLSHVLWICTANSTATVPSSLLDRMTVVRVGEPGPEHLGLLAPALAREACSELGLDERWGALDSEEIAALAIWRGGSVRRLQRMVRGILQARDLAPVAKH